MKEGFVEAPPEAIDEESIEIGFVAAGKGLGPEKAERDERGVEQAEAPGHDEGDAQGIGKEVAGEVDTREAWPPQQHAILALRVRRRPTYFPDTSARLGCEGAQHHLSRQLHVVPAGHVVRRRRPLARQHGEPPVHHPLALGEEAVATDVDAVAVVHVGLRDAADGRRRFDDHGMHVGARQQLPGGGQAGRSSARDHGDALHSWLTRAPGAGCFFGQA